ncbi:hypothetical protein [Limimaricola sp.]|uniref:hypothetical protein n=1 Tax=Limimaricola sp. TaxID=2211665 RepID=UPI0025C42543|nr:hypothetical protein [Limimaricola sp.]
MRGSAEDFVAATQALADRVRREGHPGVLSYRFWVDAASAQGRAVIDYADAAAWTGHHDIAMDWPEMAALHEAAALSEVTFLGKVTPEILAWMADGPLHARLIEGYVPSAGFAR